VKAAGSPRGGPFAPTSRGCEVARGGPSPSHLVHALWRVGGLRPYFSRWLPARGSHVAPPHVVSNHRTSPAILGTWYSNKA